MRGGSGGAMRRAATWALWAALAGCGGGEDAGGDAAVDAAEPVPPAGDMGVMDAEPLPDASAEGEGWVELGTGARRYEPLSAGQEVPIIAGIQGGFHVWGGFRGDGFADDEVRIRFELSRDGVSYAAADYTEFGLPRGRDGAFDYAAVAVVFCDNDEVQASSGQTMTLRLAVEAADGQVLTDAIEVVPRCCE